MSNTTTVEKFFQSYLKHDFQGMHACLDDGVHFSDYAFDDIQGAEVRAMWQWFCTRTPPIDMLGYKVLREDGDTVIARYRVRYLYRPEEKAEARRVDYVIASTLRLAGGKITQQHDCLYEISEFDFAKMLVGMPKALLAYTPLLKMVVRGKMAASLKAAMSSSAVAAHT